jgi:hypothetical protein
MLSINDSHVLDVHSKPFPCVIISGAMNFSRIVVYIRSTGADIYQDDSDIYNTFIITSAKILFIVERLAISNLNANDAGQLTG